VCVASSAENIVQTAAHTRWSVAVF